MKTNHIFTVARPVLIVWVFVSQSCVKTNSLINNELSPDAHASWERGVDRDKKRLSLELQDTRGLVLSRQSAKLHVWEARKDGKVSYFIGTMHKGISWSSYPLRSRYCVSGAKTVVFEIAEDETSSLTNVYLNQHGDAINSEPRAKEIGPTAWQRYLEDLAPINPRGLESLAPTEALSLYLVMRDSWIRGELPEMDSEIRTQAMEERKNIKVLESDKDLQTLWQQLAASTERVSLERMREIFAGDPTSYYLEQMRNEYKLLVKYKDGTPKDLVDAFAVPHHGLSKVLLKDRNQMWEPKLEKILADGNAFIVVGIAHLVGPDNLIDALKKKGYDFKYTQGCDAFERS